PNAQISQQQQRQDASVRDHTSSRTECERRVDPTRQRRRRQDTRIGSAAVGRHCHRRSSGPAKPEGASEAVLQGGQKRTSITIGSDSDETRWRMHTGFGCSFLVVGCWLLVVGCWLLVVCRWLVVIGWWLLVCGCWLLVVGCWLLVVGCWLLVVGCWLLVVGCWLLVVGCWLLVVGCWLLVVGCW